MRARASKKSILAFITITLSVKMMNLQNPHFYSPHHQKLSPQNLPLQIFLSLFLFNRRVVFSQTTCCFLSTDVSFFFNRRVVFSQTTCWFPSNHVLFFFNRRVVFSQTTCCFLSTDVSFFFNRRVVFSQTTCWFPSNHVLFFFNRRVVFVLKSGDKR